MTLSQSKQKHLNERRNKRLEREKSILTSATDLFVQKGYEHSTTKEIAAKANCAEGLLFKYFQGKANLLTKLLENGIYRASKDLLTIPKNTGSLEITLLDIMRWSIDIFWNERKTFQIYYAQYLQGEINLSTYNCYEHFTNKRKEIFLNIVVNGVTENRHSIEIYENIFIAINSFALYSCAFHPSNNIQTKEYIHEKGQEFINILCKGLNHS
ncbi:TetR/AcrR family transcriptional regulator [Fluviispira multicolorata]|uniref:TetR family transcriptional regulator n=1 Tax=Fluviispira multicolorata TaxID=2654512 RepID=A0A833N3B2_9BACT|nr:TetR/AcrR family transcriptional regulator [Fluviispira multicolorata]KAB8028104.1 TetR family transcriptional regulator [Fluviispira multicolorata]